FVKKRPHPFSVLAVQPGSIVGSFDENANGSWFFFAEYICGQDKLLSRPKYLRRPYPLRQIPISAERIEFFSIFFPCSGMRNHSDNNRRLRLCIGLLLPFFLCRLGLFLRIFAFCRFLQISHTNRPGKNQRSEIGRGISCADLIFRGCPSKSNVALCL